MSVAGTYAIVTKTPMGDQSGTFTVTVDGDTFTGSVVGSMGNMDVADGKVAGNTLTWKMDMKVPMPMTLDCEATIDGDALTSLPPRPPAPVPAPGVPLSFQPIFPAPFPPAAEMPRAEVVPPSLPAAHAAGAAPPAPTVTA